MLYDLIECGAVRIPDGAKSKDTVYYTCGDCSENKTVSLVNLKRGIKIHGYPRCNGCVKTSKYKSKWVDKVKNYIVGELPSRQADVAIFWCPICGGHYKIKVVNWLRKLKDEKDDLRCIVCTNTSQEKRENLSKALSGNSRSPHSEETKKKMSESAKKRWQNDDEFREKTLHRLKTQHQDPKFREKWYQRHISADEQRVESRKKTMPEANVKRRIAMRKNWRDDEYRESVLKKFGEYLKTYKEPSELERLFSWYLGSIDEHYEREYQVGPYSIDFYVPGRKTFVEVQGLYYHHPDPKIRSSYSNAPRIDKSKKSYVTNRFPDYDYIQLWEDRFNAFPGLSTIFSLGTVDFSFDNVDVLSADRKDSFNFLQLFHYLEKGRLAAHRLGAYFKGRLIGVLEHSHVVREQVATSMGFAPHEVREISRFCIHPIYQKRNFASWFLSKSLKTIKKQYPSLRAVVSFSDTSWGHEGTIYKAANFSFLHKVPPDYYYANSEGFHMHKRTFYSLASRLKLTEKEAAERLNYRKVWGDKKLKFAYYF